MTHIKIFLHLIKYLYNFKYLINIFIWSIFISESVEETQYFIISKNKCNSWIINIQRLYKKNRIENMQIFVNL